LKSNLFVITFRTGSFLCKLPNPLKHEERERERERERGEEKVVGGSEKHYIKRGESSVLFSPVLKVPRQSPFVLLVQVCMREGKALGSE
jgi:hypothetical protein